MSLFSVAIFVLAINTPRRLRGQHGPALVADLAKSAGTAKISHSFMRIKQFPANCAIYPTAKEGVAVPKREWRGDGVFIAGRVIVA
jgi:hypothetical protein